MTRRPSSSDSEDVGFTLVELLVVVLIIGILAAIAIPIFLAQKQKSVDAGLKSDLRNAAATQETYFVDHATYASTTQLTELRSSGGNTIIVVGATASGFCMQGEHDSAASLWNYSSTTGMITSGPCP